MNTDSSNSAKTPTPDSVRFIPEQVADTDQFQHQSVARMLARVIVRHEQLRTIGLLGKWGSGKSTTISYIPEEVKKISEDTCLLFTYDAWLYQSDAPRPAFIDALFEFLVKEKRLNRSDWTDHVAILTGHLQVTYASERPFSSLTSRMMLLALLGLPVAGLIMDHHDLITKQWSQWTEWRLAIAAAFLAVLPVTVWAVGQVFRGLGWVFRSLSRRILQTIGDPKKTRGDGPLARWLSRWRAKNILMLDQRFSPKPRDESWSWIFSRKPQATEQRKVGKSTPSTADFQRAFRSMVTAALDASVGKQRLIIAVDNLDRLPVPEAVALWAVIRSFFLGPTAGDDRDISRLTVILPMDEHYVAQVQGQGQSGAPPADASAGDSTTVGDLAQGLMEKTFDLTLRLPRPTFVNWQGYFARQLAFALYRKKKSPDNAAQPEEVADIYDIDDVDVVDIGTILNDAWHARAAKITPRMVNAMVNRIIATRLQSEGSNISLLVVAYYAINQDEIDRNLLDFLKTAVPLRGVDDRKWESWLAALHFGIEPDKATEVLLTRPIRDAIDDFSAEKFRDLSFREGFSSVLKSIIASYDVTTFDVTVLQAADLFATVQLKSQLAQTQIRRQLCIAFNHAKRSGQIAPEHVPGLRALLQASDETTHLSHSALINQFVGNLGDVEHGWSDADHGVFDELLNQVDPPRNDQGRTDPLVVSTEPMTFFSAAETALRHKAWIKILKTDRDDRVLDALGKKLEDPEGGENALIQVIRSGVRGNWKAVVDQLIEGFEKGHSLIPLSTSALGMGFLRRREARVRQTLSDLQASTIPAMISTAFSDGDMTLTGRLLSLALLDDAALLPVYSWTDQERSDRVDDLVDEVALDLRDFGSIAERSVARLNGVVQANPHLTGLMSRVFAKWLQAEPTKQGLTTLLADLSFYRQYASTFEVQNLIDSMSSSEIFWKALKTLHDDQAWPLLLFLRDSQALPAPQVEPLILVRLKKMRSRDWINVVRAGGPALDGLAGISRPTVSLPELSAALDTLIGYVAEQPRMLGRWAMTARRLPGQTRDSLFTHLADALLTPKYTEVASAAVVHMPELTGFPAFQAHPDLALARLVPGLISSSAATDDILHAAQALLPIVQRASPETRKAIEADLFAGLSAPPRHSIARGLAKVWAGALNSPGAG